MDIPLKNKVIVFDLDDTLYKEIDFLKSGFLKIAQILEPENFNALSDQMLQVYNAGEDVFKGLIEKYQVTKESLLSTYRNHIPAIDLDDDVLKTLKVLKAGEAILGIITDGRSVTQRNKLRTLGIDRLIDDIIISEESGSDKLDDKNFLFYMKKYPGKKYFYLGDNTQKDFIAPNRLGWITICLIDDGRNIHPQEFESAPAMLPDKKIPGIKDLLAILDT